MENDLSTKASLAWIIGTGAVCIAVIHIRGKHYENLMNERFFNYLKVRQEKKNHDK